MLRPENKRVSDKRASLTQDNTTKGRTEKKFDIHSERDQVRLAVESYAATSATSISHKPDTTHFEKKLGTPKEHGDDLGQDSNTESDGAEGYRKRAERSRKLEEEMKSISKEANEYLD